MKSNNIKLPEFAVERVVSSLSEVVDWGLRRQRVPETWTTTMGEGITIYLLDTGRSDHADLLENTVGQNGFIERQDFCDHNGHSSHCAGVIAAAKNSMGMVGVAPKAKIVFIKCLSDSGLGSSQSVINALKFCLEVKEGKFKNFPEPDIISMSLGCPQDIPDMHRYIKKLYEKNVPVICATGNEHSGVSYPAKYPETIAVSAYDPSGKIAKFSNYGPEVDFSAPGVGIYSTYLNGEYAKLSGTSMATPFVVGVIALMLSKHKKQEQKTGTSDCKTVAEMKNHLIKYSMDAGEIGKDNEFGYGIIDTSELIKENSEIARPTSKIKTGIFTRIMKWFKKTF